jgi:hypothetical protein
MAGAALGIASSLLPSAAAAASGDEDEQTPTVAFAPEYRIFNTGFDPTTVQVQMGWATEYSYAGSFVNGTSGTLEPFTYEITTTNPSNNEPVSTTGSSGSSAYVNLVGIPAKVGMTVTVRMTSVQYPGDVRTFSRTR